MFNESQCLAIDLPEIIVDDYNQLRKLKAGGRELSMDASQSFLDMLDYWEHIQICFWKPIQVIQGSQEFNCHMCQQWNY